MSETKFSNQIWIAEELDDDSIIITTSKRRMESKVDIVKIDIGYDGFIGEEQLAAAHLIAAAPEFYQEIQRDIENLKSLLCDMDSASLEFAAAIRKIDRKEKLLAKARGEA